MLFTVTLFIYGMMLQVNASDLNSGIEIEIIPEESELLIINLSELKYKEVHKTIDYLKQNSMNVQIVSVPLDTAEKVLSYMIQRPFYEVYVLVGKIYYAILLEKNL